MGSTGAPPAAWQGPEIESSNRSQSTYLRPPRVQASGAGSIHRKKLTCAKFVEFFAGLLPTRVAMEACADSHYWARTLQKFRHEVDLLPARQVHPFVLSNKDDAADARGIWTAATHGDIRRVPVKSVDRQAVLSLHRTPSHWVEVRTATINAMRGLLYEFGVFLSRMTSRPSSGRRTSCTTGRL
jgi:transposase